MILGEAQKDIAQQLLQDLQVYRKAIKSWKLERTKID